MYISHMIRQVISKPFVLPLNTSVSSFIPALMGVTFRWTRIRLGGYDPLTRLAHKWKSDKGVTIFPFHGYAAHYFELFQSHRQRPLNILEIGLARRTDRTSLAIKCPSLCMWLDFFPNANVYGFDLDDFSGVSLPRTKIFRGDQGNTANLLNTVSNCPPFDIIIDDGSHASYHQQVSLRALFPHLSSGGIYIIEDLLWQPSDLEASLPASPKTKALLKDLSALRKFVEHVREVRFYDSQTQSGKGGMAAIFKE